MPSLVETKVRSSNRLAVEADPRARSPPGSRAPRRTTNAARSAHDRRVVQRDHDAEQRDEQHELGAAHGRDAAQQRRARRRARGSACPRARTRGGTRPPPPRAVSVSDITRPSFTQMFGDNAAMPAATSPTVSASTRGTARPTRRPSRPTRSTSSVPNSAIA